MSYGPAFGFGAPLSDDPDAIRRLLLGGQGFGGPPTMGLPAQPDPGLAERPGAFGFGAMPARPLATGRHPFDYGQVAASAEAEPGVVPLPPERPTIEMQPGSLPAPGTIGTGELSAPRPPSFGFGKPAAQPQQADLPVQGASPVAAAGYAPAAPQSGPEPSFGDTIFAGLDRFRDRGGFDLLGSLGIGLMSTPGLGQGIASGLLNHQSQERSRAVQKLAGVETALKLNKLQKEAGGENQTVELLVRNGYPRETAQAFVSAAAGGNREALSNALNRLSPKPTEAPSGYTIDPTTGQATFIPGGPQDPATIAAQTAARASDEPQLVDVPQPDGSVQKVWMRKGEADGTAVGAAKRGAPIVKELEGADGVKRPYMQDPTTRQWQELQLPNAGPGGNPYATGRFNNEQGKAAGFSDRMMGSERVLRGVEGVNTTPGASNIAGSQFFPNALKSNDRQKLEQARRDFVNAQLRRESGAAISPSEFDNARQQYFPQPGDGADVIAQKRLARQRAIEAMGREGGPSYRPGYVFDPKGNITPYQSGGMANRSAIEAEMRRRGLQP